jgi:hypothetical protein
VSIGKDEGDVSEDEEVEVEEADGGEKKEEVNMSSPLPITPISGTSPSSGVEEGLGKAGGQVVDGNKSDTETETETEFEEDDEEQQEAEYNPDVLFDRLVFYLDTKESAEANDLKTTSERAVSLSDERFAVVKETLEREGGRVVEDLADPELTHIVVVPEDCSR